MSVPMPEPTARYSRSWSRPAYVDEDAARVYRASCVAQAFDRARAVGTAPVTAPEVTETDGRLTVAFGTARTSSLDSPQLTASALLREEWELVTAV